MLRTSMMAGVALVLLCCGRGETRRRGGIEQAVELRDGAETVRGVDIHLGGQSFLSEVKPDEIEIVESKYGRDIKALMTWSVSPDRKTLSIRFKPGMGDFGSGNAVTVRLRKSALENPAGPGDRLEWSIDTDPQ